MQSRPVAVIAGEGPSEQTTAQLEALVASLTEVVQANDPGDLTVVFDNHLI